MDGFGAGAGQFKSYEYKKGEIMVLELADDVRKKLEPRNKNGDVQSLKGQIKMADFGSAITSSSSSYQKALKREQKRQAIRHRNQMKRDAASRAQIYIPKTPETAASYEEITAIISDLVGGIPDDILHQTAYEILRVLKADGITDTQRTTSISDQLCVQVPSEIISRLFTIAADLTDFTINSVINLDEVDEDSIVAVGNEADDDDMLSSSSSDEEIDEIDPLARPKPPPSNWNIERLKEVLVAEFPEESDSKLDIILKLLQNESGAKLETEIARVFKFKHLDIVADIIKNKDSIIIKNSEESTELKRLDLDKLIFEEGSHFSSITNPVLPVGVKPIDTDEYREITVPFSTEQVTEPLVPILDLPEFARAAFSSYTTLNRVQSILYKTAMETDKNILVAAPTGAGKTNIALLCMLREFHLRPGTKVVYVAPMKSLVQEMVGSFSYRLESYGKTVVELTGDSSASKAQLSHADVIVTTPEKWDIITRKVGSRILTEKVSLFIIDEIHLLHDERGPVLEALVARMKRTVDTTRQQLRFVGLSATMPNYEDVALFLRVNDGLFVFDERYRPCPLTKVFIGVKNKSGLKAKREMNDICYKKIVERVTTAQVLVFVHSRRETSDTVRYFIQKAIDAGESNLFSSPNTRTADILEDAVDRAHNQDLKAVIPAGFAFHNAGLDADDRKLVESLFAKGYVKVLVSTATLAWGVNLPAHTVIIKGTRVYNPEHSRWENLSHLDVLQMFGRAGRPQFDTHGEGIILTELRELEYYVSVLNQQLPIESHFLRDVASHLNAEISLGTITSLDDAAEWIGFTYLFVRMLRSPILYQVDENDDKSLRHRRLEIVHSAALILDEKRLIRYDQKTGEMKPTELGRIAADFYISPETMSKFAKFLRPNMTDSDIFRLFCASSEFKNVSVRPEEKGEVSKLINHVPIPIKEPSDDPSAKINCLLQCYICRISLRGFSLMADMIYISQNAERLMRCMYEIALSFGWADVSLNLLSYAKMIGARMWNVQSPLRQFKSMPLQIVAQLERKYFPWGRYFDLSPQKLGELAKSPKDGDFIAETIRKFPRLKVSARKLPLTRNLIKFVLEIEAEFDFDPEVHHETEPFWVFVCDSDLVNILHSELFLLKSRHPQITLSFVVTLIEPIQPFYFIKVISDRWIPCETAMTVTLMDIVKPDPGHQKFIKVGPNEDDPYLPIVFAARNNPEKSILIAAPANGGKYSCCEKIIEDAIQMNQKIAIIVPVYDKFKRIARKYSTKYNFIPLTGDPDGDRRIINTETRIIGTHLMYNELESYDTVFLYDIHLIGDENFADYESLVSIWSAFNCTTRFIAVSSPLTNAKSFLSWLKIDPQFSFVFSPQMRDISFQIQTFNFPTSKARLMAMARPLFSAVKNASTSIIFVPSQSQMFMTVFELINFANISENPKTFVRYTDPSQIPQLTNQTLKEVAEYGVALFYPSLPNEDKTQILTSFGSVFGCIVAVIDSVWELNMMAEVVAMKGTDIYDGSSHHHVEYPIMLTMEAMGNTLDGGKFVLFTHTPKKLYYISSLTEPICVESNFDLVAQDTFNMITSLGLALSKGDFVKFVVRTLYYRRLISNPSHYGLVSNEQEFLADYVSELVDNATENLSSIHALQVGEDDLGVNIQVVGQIAANHHIDPATTDLILKMVTPETAYRQLLRIACASSEFSLLPLRSPKTVANMMKHFPDATGEPDDPSVLAQMILRSHLANIPIPDDCKDTFAQICPPFLRIINAAIDVAAAQGWLKPTVGAIQLLQQIVQGVAIGSSELLQLPYVDSAIAERFKNQGIRAINELRDIGAEEGGEELCKTLLGINGGSDVEEQKWQDVCNAVNKYPGVVVSASRISSTTVKVVLERDIDEDEEVSIVVEAPRFPIQKTENWFIIIADESEELVSLQKVMLGRTEEVILEMKEEEVAGPLRAFILCDSYIGCDRACDVA
ncbi:small nuclear ribonucleoprotein [Tritrichomonas foetus]|uniref:Small nuclear ribonucleoprotein n=1 Tax=Tritrichomonas foetus TaxID=1144522 RepID=A0A1J4KBD8_9EUKA|nr:small nuclear ribonucleoprotein [Tritrichomonas foetus]|eukprot:OHT07006.1 small nuclear ribonucleoprotein [Tritrichomonas foetus]